MKIGILTFHYAHNYGAVLQAYALSTFLKKKGYQAQIVDYRLPYIYNQYLPLDFSYFYYQYKKNNSPLLSFLKACNYYRTHRHRNKQWHRFVLFRKKVLPHTRQVFSLKEIEMLDLDVFIFGSDQIWNNRLTRHLEPIYFGMGFANNKRKISYAGSNGMERVEDDVATQFKCWLKKLDAISVREKGLSSYLKSEGIDNECVLDPIFLLNKNEWTEISTEFVYDNYLLTYSFSEDSNFFDEVLAFAHSRNLKVVSLLYAHRADLANEIIQIVDAGPREFLGYFKNASFVITNSFHGTAFSVLFEQQFLCAIPRKGRERIDSLLENLGLENRVFSESARGQKSIDYRMVQERLDKLRESSWQFLHKNLKQ